MTPEQKQPSGELRENLEKARELGSFLEYHRDVFDLLFDQQISPGKAIEALCEYQAGNEPALPESRSEEEQMRNAVPNCGGSHGSAGHRPECYERKEVQPDSSTRLPESPATSPSGRTASEGERQCEHFGGSAADCPNAGCAPVAPDALAQARQQIEELERERDLFQRQFRTACLWVWKGLDAPGQTLEITMQAMIEEEAKSGR